MELTKDHLIPNISRFAPILWKARHRAAKRDTRHWTLRFVIDGMPMALLMCAHDEIFDKEDNILSIVDFEIFDIFYMRATYLTPHGHDTDCEGNWFRKPIITDRFHESSFRLRGTTTNDEFEHIMMMLALHLAEE